MGARPAAAPSRARPASPAKVAASPGKAYPLLFVTSLALVLIGLVMILSASSVEAYKQYGSSFLFFYRQTVGVFIGLFAMVILARMDYRKLRRIARPLFILCIILLGAVLVPGISVTRAGSSRWLDIGLLTFQPSELAKLSLIMFCATALAGKETAIRDIREMAIPVLPAAGILAMLVMAQPDLGTTIICLGCAFVVVFLAGAQMKHLAALAGVGGLCIAGLALSEGYRRARLFSFFDPWADPLNSGYHIIQGQIAFGSGGWFGLGLGASRQKWSYVPNAHTDFIYAILGEELGLMGTLTVLLLFGLVLALGIRIAKSAPDRFGFLLAGGITGWIGLQALVNMGAVSGLLPITGVPLPLISFGGSSLVFTLAAIGILLSIAKRGRA
ncbi:MAG: putative lipid II flippase FtsW [Actinomycetota bacterium]